MVAINFCLAYEDIQVHYLRGIKSFPLPSGPVSQMRNMSIEDNPGDLAIDSQVSPDRENGICSIQLV